MSQKGELPPRERDPSVSELETRIGAPTSRAIGVLSRGQLIAERYRIVRFIAGGGMGDVYEAHDIELGISVALKTIAASIIEQPTALARLKREVLLARNITHPNVCRRYDLGRDFVLGLFFITMELLHGENIHSLLERARSPEQA